MNDARPPDRTTLTVRHELPGVSPAAVFACWVEPELLTRWWPPEAVLDARPGGEYHLAWPAMNWNLRGTYTTVDRPRTLAFTWQWDHEPEQLPEQVVVRFLPDGESTVIIVEHGPHEDSPVGDERRRGHREGWEFFLGRLECSLADG